MQVVDLQESERLSWGTRPTTHLSGRHRGMPLQQARWVARAQRDAPGLGPRMGFVRLCGAVEGESEPAGSPDPRRCDDGAIVRGIDGIRLLVDVLRR
jgi:hypothetical protein